MTDEELRAELKEELRKEIKDELIEEIKKELRLQIDEELRTEITNELKQKMDDEIANQKMVTVLDANSKEIILTEKAWAIIQEMPNLSSKLSKKVTP